MYNQVLKNMGSRPLRTVVSSKVGKHDNCHSLNNRINYFNRGGAGMALYQACKGQCLEILIDVF